MTIHLEPFTKRDMDRLISWVESCRFLMQWAGVTFRYPLDREQLRYHMRRADGSRPFLLLYKAVDSHSGETLGHGELAAIDRVAGSTTLARILVGPAERRGQGIGSQIVQELLNVAFGELGLHRADLRVYDFNTAAIRCYEKAGLRLEGTLREARRFEQEYWNIHVMGILEEEWRAAQSALSTASTTARDAQ